MAGWIDEIVRGPLKFANLDDVKAWTVVRGKNPGGFQPGFRASHEGDPEQVYQLEVDPPKHPQMASGAEFIGTLIYHALGYHVVDVYTIKVDPRALFDLRWRDHSRCVRRAEVQQRTIWRAF